MTYNFNDDLYIVLQIEANERCPAAATVQEVLNLVALLEQGGYRVAFTLKNE